MTVLIIGAGIAGLTAAMRLTRAGLHPVIVDKGRAVGGRMATRSVDDARYDHGAQHVGARTPEFEATLGGLRTSGVARQWFDAGSPSQPNLRYVGIGGMRRIPEHLAVDLDVRTSITIERLERTRGGVQAVADGRSVAEAAAAIVTPPLPQTLRLLDAGGIPIHRELRRELEGVEYDACLAVMARMDGPSGLPDGHRTVAIGPVAWIADNHHKGVSAVPAVTIHSSAAFARQHLDSDPAGWIQTLVQHTAPHLESSIRSAAGHRWRYSQPRSILDVGAAVVGSTAPIVLAGDAFAGPRVEGAFLSGVTAARLLLNVL